LPQKGTRKGYRQKTEQTMNWAAIVKNWKTSISGAVLWLLSIDPIYSAIQDYAQGKPVNWKNVLLTAILWAAGHGLIQAKDSTTHSTYAEMQAATTQAEIQRISAANKNQNGGYKP
jgi:hypothetical protein